MDFITLRNGVKMPIQGFGVFRVSEASVCEMNASDDKVIFEYKK